MRLLRFAWIGAYVCCFLIVAAMIVSALSAREAWLVEAHSESMVVTNKELWEIDAPPENSPGYSRAVMKIYGNPAGEAPLLWLFIPEEKFFHPGESKDPGLRLLLVDRKKGEDPLQLLTVLFVGRWVAGGAAITGYVLMACWFLLKRRLRPVA